MTALFDPTIDHPTADPSHFTTPTPADAYQARAIARAAELIEAWAEALESGRYAPTHHSVMHDGAAYGPLGVLCDVYRLLTHRGEWTPPAAGEGVGWSYLGSRYGLPDEVARAGRFGSPPLVRGDGDPRDVAFVHDLFDDGASFTEIAAAIRDGGLVTWPAGGA